MMTASGTAGKRSVRLLTALVTILVSCLLAGSLSALTPQVASAATVSDNFNRANGGLGSNWTTATGTAAPAIVSNTLQVGTASKLNSAYWSASTFGNDQFAQANLPASSGTQFGPGIAVRLSSTKGYFLWYGNNSNTVSLWRMDTATSWTQLKQSSALTISPSTDVWKIQAVGSTISGYQNGKLVVQATDTKITSGSPGVWLYNSSNQITNWSGGDVSTGPTYSVGGTVSGLSGTVVLENNGGNDLSVSASGPFTFSSGLAAGAAYNVTVKTNPPGQTCSVANGTGTIGSANVTNVAVTCAAVPTYSVGGTVSGLSGTVVLQNNGGNNLSVSASGPFTFSTSLAAGAAYAVTVTTSPSGQTCSVANGTGTIGTSNVTNVAVTCSNNAAGTATDNFNRANGPLGPNWTNMTDGGLAISSQAVTGTNSANSGDIRTAETYTSDQYSQIEVTSTQLSGGQWIGPAVRAQNGGLSAYLGIYYWNFGNPDLMLFKRISGGWTQLGSTYASGALTAGTQLKITAVGSTISFLQNGVQVMTATDTSLTGGAPGIIAYQAPTADNWAGGSLNIPGTYSVGGNVSGLSGTVVLQNNSGDDLSVSTAGPFTFATDLANGAAYNVTVKTNPAGQTCAVTSGSGTISSANVTNVAVTCSAAATYSVGGTVSGLTGTVVLQDNGGNDLSVSANGAFTFTTQLTSGSVYNVTVKTGPTGQTCTVANGSGTMPAANVTNVAVTCTTSSAGSGSDNFNRADGPLGAGWADTSDGGLTISSQVVAGTNAAGTTGDVRTAESYSSNQYSQIEVTSTQLTGSQWIGTAVRTQNGGQSGYVGLYAWNGGSPELMLFKRNSSTNWTQLGSYSSGPLAAGTQLKLMVVGTTLSFLENGAEKLAVYDNSFSSGAPGIIIYGTATADNWAAGSAGFEVHYLSTDANGVESYDMISASNGDGPQVLRVLRPTNPAAGVAHNFLFVLPVEAGLGNSFGDGLATIQSANAQNQYNLTLIEPSFAIQSWYADNPNDANLQYETFLTSELAPWVKTNLATTGTEQNWLIGFSKSGIGGQDLVLKHPDVFTLAATWDFPADMSSYDQFSPSSSASYGTDANFQANYRLTQAFVDAHKAPFLGTNRMWIGNADGMYQGDMTDYNALLTSEGIAHSTEPPSAAMAHRWDSGWVPAALAALEQESLNVH